MPEALLAEVRAVDLAGDPAAMTGRILADLGAEVVKVEGSSGAEQDRPAEAVALE